MGIGENLKEMKIGNYLRELSVVIIGVAVTFIITGWINSWNEHKDLELQLSAVYSELEDNLQIMDDYITYYEDLAKLRSFLYQSLNDPQPFTNDSIKKYEYATHNTKVFIYKKGAYEMFVNSGAMKLLSDRSLLLAITNCYAYLEAAKQVNEEYMNAKYMIFHEVYRKDKKIVFDKSLNITSPELNMEFNFHALNSGREQTMKNVRTQIQETLSKRKN